VSGETTPGRRILTPWRLQRHLGKVALAAAVVLALFGLKNVHLARVAADDDSTPEIAPGSRVLVRTVEEDGGELKRGALYLVDLAGDAEKLSELRLERLIGLPSDDVVRRESTLQGRVALEIGGTTVVVPAELADFFPSRVPEGCCLLLTDNPACRHLDSRALGPLPVERLKLRVVAGLGSFLH